MIGGQKEKKIVYRFCENTNTLNMQLPKTNLEACLEAGLSGFLRDFSTERIRSIARPYNIASLLSSFFALFDYNIKIR